ncbi:MAG: formate dehydrogenase accessory sulfurtransferase FdhD [Smithellaceae bacterium]|nr:formate dehydrogenase accessory sulfurtransferase FdhD [Smithellaceae bacterium]
MTLPNRENIILHEYRDGVLSEVSQPFSTEYAVLLKINGNPYVMIACSGNYIREHITGYLITEGIISNTDQIDSMDIDEANLTVNAVLDSDKIIAEKLEWIKTITAAGGRSRKNMPSEDLVRKSLPQIRAEVILKSMSEFLTYSREHEATHGVHGAALYSLKGGCLAFFDEIGRHNAIDKVIGHAVVNGIPLEDKMICSTGRISSEIAFKIIHARAPALVTRASPTVLSVSLLRRYNILSIIRAVKGRFYVVNGKEKIIL